MVKNCQICEKEFVTYPSHVERGAGKFCSYACAGEAKKGKPSYERTDEHKEAMSEKLKGREPNWDAIWSAADARRGKPIPDHQKKILSERWAGDKNPKWAGGISFERYAQGYWNAETRQNIIDRDKICQDCGKEDESYRAMHIHHIDGLRVNHSEENLVLLCMKCHRTRHKKHNEVMKLISAEMGLTI